MKLWLPPKVWLHGSQSTITGGASSVNGQTCASACWLATSMRCVLSTPLGIAVEPEVKSTFATLSGPTAANASSTARVAGVAASRGTRVAPEPLESTISAPPKSTALSTPPNGAGVGCVDEPGLDQRGDVLDLAEVLAHQRVRRRDRHDGDAGEESAERQQRVVDAVAGEDQQRPPRPEAAIQQRLRDRGQPQGDLDRAGAAGSRPRAAAAAADPVRQRHRPRAARRSADSSRASPSSRSRRRTR